MSNEQDEMKYEGLAALIVTLERNHERRHKDTMQFIDIRFTGLEEHNKKQNGSISKAMRDIVTLKSEANERKLTCGAAVKTLQREVKYTKLVLWIDRHWKWALLIFAGTLLVTQAIVHVAVAGGWLNEIWELVKGVR